MDELINTYTSTGNKLIHHTEVIERLKVKRALPVSLQMAPTSECNLKCVFCSNVNRTKHESLEADQVEALLTSLSTLGLRTVEWTGGGDPLLWEPLEDVMALAEDLGLEQGLITNGVALKNFGSDFFAKLMWVRVSLNCLDYLPNIEIPDMPHSTLGFSYVINERTPSNIFAKLQKYVEEYEPTYVRIVPNCQIELEKKAQTDRVYSDIVEGLGHPFIYQRKDFGTPEFCWWGYLKPFVLHDGWMYPCSSVVLNNNAERSFHSKYRMCRIEKIPSIYENELIPFPTKYCDRCVFERQNKLVDEIINPTGMEIFL